MAVFLEIGDWIDISSLCTHNTYTSIDTSGMLQKPASAVGCVVVFFNGLDGEFGQKASVRAVGDTIDDFYFTRQYSTDVVNPYIISQSVALTADIFECNASVDNGMIVYIIGWFESEDVTYLPNYLDILPLAETTPVDSTWFTIDLGTNASAAMGRIANNSSTTYNFRYRPVGSTRENTMSCGLASFDVVLPLTAGKVEVWASKVDSLNLHINGYVGRRFIRSNSEEDETTPLVYSNGAGSANIWVTHAASSLTDLPAVAPIVAYSTAAGSRAFTKPGDDIHEYSAVNMYGFRTFYTKCGVNGQFSIKHRYTNGPCELWGAWYPSQSTPVSVSKVNANDVIVSNGSIIIYGTALDTATAVDLGGIPLNIITQQFDQISCTAIDVFTTNIPYGKFVPITVTGPENSAIHQVTLAPLAGISYFDVNTNDGYLSSGLDVEVGDQMAYPTPIGSSEVTGYDNTDLWYDPALPDGTIHKRWWYDTSTTTWDVGDVYVNTKEVDTPPKWSGTFALPVGYVGTPYSFDVSPFCTSTLPITFSVVGDLVGLTFYPSGILSGTPTITGVAPLVFTATNSEGSSDQPPTNLTISNANIYNPQHQDVRDTSFQITCSTTTASGRIYYIVDQNPNEPTDEQIYYGKTASGSTALVQGSWAATVPGLQPWQLIQDMEPETEYYYWFVQATFPLYVEEAIYHATNY